MSKLPWIRCVLGALFCVRGATSRSFRRLLATSACIALASAAAHAETAAGPRAVSNPNLILVFADDLSDELLRTMLERGYAPNIERYLAREGVTFANSFVTNALCCPSRATLLRGQYSHNHGVLHNRFSPDGGIQVGPGIGWPGWLETEEHPGAESSTIATWLQGAGYRTAHIGRYLNGYGVCGPFDTCLDVNGEVPKGLADPALHIPAGWDDWRVLLDPTTFQVFDYRSTLR